VKVFLDCDDKVRAERILKDERKDEKSGDIKEIIKKISEREESERVRYKKYYNADYYDKKLYNLVIDTTKLDIEEVVGRIVKEC
jgi:cytidylate kinase